jgi:hypothetical protein
MSGERYRTREEYLRLPFEERLIKLEPSQDERARGLCERLVTIDLHCLSYHQFSDHESPYPRDRVSNSGLTCLLETVDNFGHNPDHEYRLASEDVRHFTNFFPEQQGIGIAYDASDIRKAKEAGRQTVMVSMEMDDSQVLTLETGRKLGYAEYGVKGGHPVFYFHGYPGSRLEAGLMKDQWEDNDIHLISVDRPGMGLSDYQPDRAILDQPDDVMEIAAHLGLDEYGVLGVSGGGPYALACAFKTPSERMTGCAVVSGSGPYYLTQEGLGKGERYMLTIAKNVPLAFRFLLWLQLGRNVEREEWWEKNYAGMTAGAPGPDEWILNEPRVKENIKAKTVEAF